MSLASYPKKYGGRDSFLLFCNGRIRFTFKTCDQITRKAFGLSYRNFCLRSRLPMASIVDFIAHLSYVGVKAKLVAKRTSATFVMCGITWQKNSVSVQDQVALEKDTDRDASAAHSEVKESLKGVVIKGLKDNSCKLDQNSFIKFCVSIPLTPCDSGKHIRQSHFENSYREFCRKRLLVEASSEDGKNNLLSVNKNGEVGEQDKLCHIAFSEKNVNPDLLDSGTNGSMEVDIECKPLRENNRCKNKVNDNLLSVNANDEVLEQDKLCHIAFSEKNVKPDSLENGTNGSMEVDINCKPLRENNRCKNKVNDNLLSVNANDEVLEKDELCHIAFSGKNVNPDSLDSATNGSMEVDIECKPLRENNRCKNKVNDNSLCVNANDEVLEQDKLCHIALSGKNMKPDSPMEVDIKCKPLRENNRRCKNKGNEGRACPESAIQTVSKCYRSKTVNVENTSKLRSRPKRERKRNLRLSKSAKRIDKSSNEMDNFSLNVEMSKFLLMTRRPQRWVSGVLLRDITKYPIYQIKMWLNEEGSEWVFSLPFYEGIESFRQFVIENITLTGKMQDLILCDDFLREYRKFCVDRKLLQASVANISHTFSIIGINPHVQVLKPRQPRNAFSGLAWRHKKHYEKYEKIKVKVILHDRISVC